MVFSDICDRVEFDTNGGCWLWDAGISSAGYGSISVEGRTWQAHRAVMVCLGHEVGAEDFVLHKCDVRACVNPSHLRIGSHTDNMIDAAKRGRFTKAKLTESDVHAIRLMASKGLARHKIAKEFGVSKSTIFAITLDKNWKWLGTEIV